MQRPSVLDTESDDAFGVKQALVAVPAQNTCEKDATPVAESADHQPMCARSRWTRPLRER